MKTRIFPFSFNASLALMIISAGALSAVAFDEDTEIPKLAVPAPADTPKLASLGNRVHTVKLGREGLVPGRIAITNAGDGQTRVVRDVKVHFVKNGQPVAVVEPGVNGVFQADGISPGEYAVVAVGPEVVAAYAVNVVDGVVDGSPADATLQLQSQGIHKGDFPAVASLMDSYVSADFCARFCGGSAPAQIAPVVDQGFAPLPPSGCAGCSSNTIAVPAAGGSMGILPSISTGVGEIISSPAPAPVLAPIAEPSASISTESAYAFTAQTDVEASDDEGSSEDAPLISDTLRARPVRLAKGGKVGGRIAWATAQAPYQKSASQAVVAFIRDGKVAQMTKTDADGAFEVEGLSAGTYSVFTSCDSGCGTQGVAVQSGCSCFSVDCLPPVETPVVNDPCCSQVDACLVGCSNMDYTADQICGSLCGGGVVDGGIVAGPGALGCWWLRCRRSWCSLRLRRNGLRWIRRWRIWRWTRWWWRIGRRAIWWWPGRFARWWPGWIWNFRGCQRR